MADGFHVEVDALESAARGIDGTRQAMTSFKLGDLTGPEEMYGSGQLRDAVEHFCDRWQDGADILLTDTDRISQALREASALYRTIDDTNADAIAAHGVVGSGDA